MQVIAGFAKHMKMKVPKGQGTRPTSAKVREALASILAPEIDGGRVLDLFAGSGSVGIEFLSRGSVSAIFVEQNRDCVSCLQANVAEYNRRMVAQSRKPVPIQVWPVDVKKSLSKLTKTSQFDIIWADPPYAQCVSWAEIFSENMKLHLSSSGVFGFECGTDSKDEIESIFQGRSWCLDKSRQYGQTAILFFSLGGES